MAQQKILIPIPEDLKPRERQLFAEEIIETIKVRSESGYGVREDGTKYRFPAYSKSYTQSLDFKVAGKSAGSVDLTLSGDMLASISLLDHGRGYVVVGFSRGSEENDRAEGNQLGSYGGEPNPKKARRFLGATTREVEAALRAIKDG
jgi:hypothetical protein